jgi:outer membrane protein
MKKRLLFAFLVTGGLLIPQESKAIPGIDVTLGVGYSTISPSGEINYNGDYVDVEHDLGLGDSKKANVYVDVDLPILPHVKLEYFPFRYQGQGKVNKNFTFGNLNINVDEKVKTDMNFDQYDLTLYYGLPVPFLHPKIGLSVKYLDGYVELFRESTSESDKADITIPIPMLYLGASISVPLIPMVSDLVFDLEGKGISYDGNSLVDVKALAKVKLLRIPAVAGIYAGLGYKYQRLKIDNLDVDGKDFNSDVKFQGILGEVGIEF